MWGVLRCRGSRGCTINMRASVACRWLVSLATSTLPWACPPQAWCCAEQAASYGSVLSYMIPYMCGGACITRQARSWAPQRAADAGRLPACPAGRRRWARQAGPLLSCRRSCSACSRQRPRLARRCSGASSSWQRPGSARASWRRRPQVPGGPRRQARRCCSASACGVSSQHQRGRPAAAQVAAGLLVLAQPLFLHLRPPSLGWPPLQVRRGQAPVLEIA